MPGLPVILQLAARRCVIVGGGDVALRRARTLLDAGAAVAIIAPAIVPALRSLPLTCHARPYQPGDLTGAALVVVATDDPSVNQAVSDDARAAGILVNRADDPAAGDVAIPAHAHHGPVTLAVHTDGISAAAAAAIRRKLSDALDPDWPRLLDAAAPHRRLIQQRVTDAAQRTSLLRRLTDDDAMTILKRDGLDALHAHLRRVSDGVLAPAGGVA